MTEEQQRLNDESEEMALSIKTKTGNLRAASSRDLEDVDYWRKRAGWFDDDKSMKDYNNGVYDKYYGVGDDDGSRRRSSNHNKSSAGHSAAFSNTVKVFAAMIGIALIVFMVRTVQRNRGSSSDAKRESKERSKSAPTRSDRSEGGSSRRSRSKSAPSRSRSRSKSRSNKASSNYELMEEDNESKKSSRSRSRSKRARSHSRASSRTKSGSSSRLISKEAILV